MLLQIFLHIANHFHAAIPLCLLFGFLKAIVQLEEQSGLTVRRYPVHLKAKKSLDYEEKRKEFTCQIDNVNRNLHSAESLLVSRFSQTVVEPLRGELI